MGHGAAADKGTTIEILGGLRINRGDTIVELGSSRRAQLLGRLAMDPGRWVPADSLLDDFWPDSPPTARTSLQGQIGKLRRELEPGSTADTATLIEFRDGSYRLGVVPDAVDHHLFGGLIEDARRHRLARDLSLAERRLRTALDLWAEPFGDLSTHPAFQPAATRLNEMHADAVEDLSAIEIELGEPDLAVLQDRCRSHPLRERRWSQLMLALYRAGRQTDALRAYGLARSTLIDEVGVEPGPELQRLERMILDQDPSLLRTPEPATAGPEDPSSFVGRERELAAIATRLGERRVVTISGPGGVGKTRLARSVIASVDPVIDGRTTWVSLASTSDPSLVRANVDDALANEGGRHRGLLVLDNCEHLREGVAEVVTELLASSDLVFLLTSQLPLGLAAEHVFELPCLPIAAEGDPSIAGSAQALLVDRLVAATGREPDATDRAAIDRIAAALDGLPLAIELVAGRARSMTLTEIEANLAGESLILSRQIDPDPRHRTMDAAVRWSTDLLSPEALQLFEDVSLFEGDFDLKATTALAAADTKLHELDIQPVLAELTDVSLLRRVDHRWRMLQPIRSIAKARLHDRGDRADIVSAHTRWFAALATDAAAGMQTPERARWVQEMNAAAPDLLAAFTRAGDAGEVRHVLDLAPGLGRALTDSSSFAAARRSMELADQVTAASRSPERCSLLQVKAWAATWDRDVEAAHQALDAAETLARDIDSLGSVANVLHSRGNVVGWLEGRPKDAVPLYREAAEIAAVAGDTIGAAATATRGYMHAYLGEHDEAIEVANDIQLLADLFDNDLIRFLAESVWAWAHLVEGRVDEAEPHFETQLRLCQEQGMVYLIPAIESRIAWLLAQRGELDPARALATAALAKAETSRANLRIADSWWVLALIARLDGRTEEAGAWLRRCAISSIATGDATMGSWTLAERALLLGDTDPALASELASAALDLSSRHGLALPVPARFGVAAVAGDTTTTGRSDADLIRLAARSSTAG